MVPLNVFPADPGDRELLGRIAVHLEGGGILAHPTETVYGLGTAATPEGVEALRKMKERTEDKPFLVLLPDATPPPHSAGDFAPDPRWRLEWSDSALMLAQAFWPGPLTLVVRDPEARFPPGVRSPRGGVAVRVDSHPFVRALLARWGAPLISTSANRPGDPAATTPEEVLHAVEGRPGLHRFWFASAGALPPSAPSTVVDCTDASPRLLRSGALPTDQIARILPGLDDDPA